MNDLIDRLFFLDEQNDQGGSGGVVNENGGGAQPGGGNQNQQRQRQQREPHPSGIELTPNAEKAFSALMTRYDDPEYAARALFSQKFQLNQQLTQRETELEQLQGRLPTDGALVLSGDEAAAVEALRKVSPLKDIPTMLQERASLRKEVDDARLDKTIQSIADKTGTNFDVLNTIGRTLTYKTNSVKDNRGQDIEQVVVVTDDGKTETPFTDYVEKHYASFKPALFKNSTGTNQNGGMNNRGGKFARQAPAANQNRQQDNGNNQNTGGYGRFGSTNMRTQQGDGNTNNGGDDRSAARSLQNSRYGHIVKTGDK